MYKRIDIKQKTKIRVLHEPDPVLKSVQHNMLNKLRSLKFRVPEYITGFMGPGCGPHTTGRYHVGKKLIRQVDIKSFFDNCTVAMVEDRLVKILKLPRISAMAIANLCSHNGCLPQGAPCSSYLGHICCFELDIRLHGLAIANNCTFSSYVDDKFFGADDVSNLEKIMAGINDIFTENGFTVKTEKLKTYKYGTKQQVMHVCVAYVPQWAADQQHTRLSKPKRKQLLSAIYNMKHLKPKGSVMHIQGLLNMARMTNDQCYPKAKVLFDEAKTLYLAHMRKNMRKDIKGVINGAEVQTVPDLSGQTDGNDK